MGGAGRRRAAFTLVEVVLAVAITAVIGLALVGIMVMAQRGLASATAEGTSAHQADRALQMMLTDINLATSITTQTATSITMVVPARNGDTQPETITYAWSGTAGTR